MEKQVFLIDFKFPGEPAGEWISFSAKVREPSLGVWEVYNFKSDVKKKFPVERIVLKRTISNWIDLETDRESLMTALIGRAIEDLSRKFK